jgi:hypothetical protein
MSVCLNDEKTGSYRYIYHTCILVVYTKTFTFYINKHVVWLIAYIKRLLKAVVYIR